MKTKYFDIGNPNPRQVVCTSVQKDVWGGENGERLELNKVYNLVKLTVHSYHTKCYLEEFPGVGFNSVLFDDIEEN